MSFRRVTAMLGLLVVPGLLLASGAGAADQDTLVKYYRKKNNVPPTETVTVKDVKDSPIKGAKQGVLEVGTAPRSRSVAFTSSPDFSTIRTRRSGRWRSRIVAVPAPATEPPTIATS